MKRMVCVLTIGMWVVISSGLALAQQQDVVQEYVLYMQLGQDALLRGDHRQALDYFSQAQMLQPAEPAPGAYLNFIKRELDGAVVEREASWSDGQRTLLVVEPDDEADGQEEDGVQSESDSLDASAALVFESTASVESKEPKRTSPRIASMTTPQSASPLPARVRSEIDLDDDLWSQQPRGLIQIVLDTSIIFNGTFIDRYLDIFPGFVEVSRMDRNRVRVTGVKRGSTILHVWDDRGRWTFNVEVLLPFEMEPQTVVLPAREELVQPFRFMYTADWGAYAVGPSLDDTKRQSLSFIQTLKTEGETPYGLADGWVTFNKFQDSTEATGYGIGLTDGRIGNFDKFRIRGFDTAKTFSALSMPGQYLRGVLFEKRALDDKVDFSYVRGRDRATYGFLAPGILRERESFVEGAKVTLFGDEENNYSFNAARGWGEARPTFLKEEVYSVEFNRRLGGSYLESELAYDSATYAGTVKTSFDKDERYDLAFNFRNIGSEFATITNLPSNRGEMGGGFTLGWDLGQARWSHYLDLYQDRLFTNPNDKDAWNIDASTYVDYRLSDTDRVTTSLFYVDTPGELTPRTNFRLYTNYSKRVDWLEDHPLTLTVGTGFQRNRFDLSPVSDFDRKMISLGMRLPIYQRLDYFLNYEFSWVDEKSQSNHTPRVMNTGVSYYHPFTDRLQANTGVTYRDEQNTEGLNSFLSGEDSLAFHLGLNYRPLPETEIFADGRIRNVWREGLNSASYHEVDTRWGLRSSWDLPLRWNPAGVVHGTVYKDFNANRQRDADEPGISGVAVRVGEQVVTTNDNGHYVAKVRAKSVFVQLGIETLPRGFVASSVPEDSITIVAHRWHAVDFGVSTQSGIFGIVYYDVNANGQPDSGDVFIQRVRLSIDDVEIAQSDFDGTYFFRDLKPGEYTLSLDVNTLPIDYIPLVKLRQPVTIEEGATYVMHIPVRKK